MGPNGAVNSVISVNGNGNYLYSGSTGVDRLFIFLAPHSSKTPQPISIKFETDDYVGDATPHAKFGYCMFSGGASPYR